MGPRATVIAGLASGGVTALVILVAAVVLLPEPSAATASPSPGPVAPSASAALSGGAASIGSTSGASPSGALIGRSAPALSLPQVGGGRIELGALRGHPVWIDFMQTTCDPCRTELPAMNDFAARYGDAGLVVIAVDVREDEPTVAALALSLNLRFPIGLDTDGVARTAWGVGSLPVHLWIDRDGVVRAQATGPLSKAAMADDLARILPALKVTAS